MEVLCSLTFPFQGGGSHGLVCAGADHKHTGHTTWSVMWP